MSRETQLIDVAIGVIVNHADEILLSKRQVGQHLGGYWEFPGGKVEPGELPLDALKREVLEEVGLDVVAADPVGIFNYHYHEKSVRLHVFSIHQFEGLPEARLGQVLRWVDRASLNQYQLPEANQLFLDLIG